MFQNQTIKKSQIKERIATQPDLTPKYSPHRFCVAPMFAWTDRHCRYFHRLLTKNALLYTEMVTTGALICGQEDYLDYSEEEQPVALQLGGHNPFELAQCTQLGEQRGYQEINLNLGCPSPRVKQGAFGAALMQDIEQVCVCLKAMCDVSSIPVTIKIRIGVDEHDSYEFLSQFIEKISREINTVIIHARKAFLSGLSPKENREIPPLDYPRVYQLKKDFPELNIVINGGISTLEEAKQHLQYVEGVMIGRAAYQNPTLLTQVDSEIFNAQDPIIDITALIKAFYPYIEQELSRGTFLNHLIRPMLGLFQGCAGARQWRRYLSENSYQSGADVSVIDRALSFVTPHD
ncbi:tRNA dihydrouridine(20/20a) synthase DusA [Candidatus Williamhamiltonella defendens]|uniref:tRNA dihydrouridine(20/20a) synthase DusA n=1 Tax=Candidatus Williamhamiltonella defendens TaxID=138072 RepID=UPI00165184AD|nr:tRNA dihydrouridine(20/20a) synthase DusA [Candidatus Hamiltonella defensa]